MMPSICWVSRGQRHDPPCQTYSDCSAHGRVRGPQGPACPGEDHGRGMKIPTSLLVRLSSLELSDCGQDVRGLGPLRVVGIDGGEADGPILANHVGRRER